MSKEKQYTCDHCGKEVGTEERPAYPRFSADGESYLCEECMNAPGMVHVWVEFPLSKPIKMGVLS